MDLWIVEDRSMRVETLEDGMMNMEVNELRTVS